VPTRVCSITSCLPLRLNAVVTPSKHRMQVERAREVRQMLLLTVANLAADCGRVVHTLCKQQL
jgi:transcriptional regulator of met regulon